MSRPLAHPESTRLRIQAFHLRHCIGQTGKPQLAQTGRLTQILSSIDSQTSRFCFDSVLSSAVTGDRRQTHLEPHSVPHKLVLSFFAGGPKRFLV
jgi:hypothetical protein